MTPLSFEEARAVVLRESCAVFAEPKIETVKLLDARARILAEDIQADRDYPPFDRSARDGFAVHSQDLPGTLRIMGESRAGAGFEGRIARAEAIEIMTGAPVPAGANAVVMVEHARRNGDAVTIDHAAEPGSNISPRGSEAAAASVVLTRGSRIEYPSIAMLASTGHDRVRVYARPVVAIVATGDEIVEIEESPGPYQIRNSNACSLAVQVERAGGFPILYPIARDTEAATRRLIERAFAEADLLLLSGGVSAGKYDVVETALSAVGAQFFFDRVRIQPGQPLVFGKVSGKLFFGLPGNPLSTMVTFEVFARLALEVLCGLKNPILPVTLATLTVSLRQKPGLTRFLPALVDAGMVTPVPWQGSGDVGSLCRANAFAVTTPDRDEYPAGAVISVLYL